MEVILFPASRTYACHATGCLLCYIAACLLRHLPPATCTVLFNCSVLQHRHQAMPPVKNIAVYLIHHRLPFMLLPAF